MKGIVLLSSGIDSPVAAYLMLKKGVSVTACHMDARPHSDDAGVEKAKSLVERVGVVGGAKVPLYVVPNSGFHEAVRQSATPKYHCVLCKRYMYRLASEIAKKEGADFIITGESIGQVASQTLDNLKILNDAAQVPVVRPLIGFDKDDTIKIARQIGTYDISSIKSVGCPFVPKHPATKVEMQIIINEEDNIDTPALIDEALKNSQMIK
jgi:thiamine biosynthesis protein ThiI